MLHPHPATLLSPLTAFLASSFSPPEHLLVSPPDCEYFAANHNLAEGCEMEFPPANNDAKKYKSVSSAQHRGGSTYILWHVFFLSACRLLTSICRNLSDRAFDRAFDRKLDNKL
jgi:hypothetical protein